MNNNINLHRTDKVKTPRVYNRKLLAIKFSVSFIICLLMSFALYGLFSFFTTYGVRTPILFQSPIYRLHPEIIVAPISTKGKKQTLKTFNLGAISDKIYQLESTSGKNDGCNKLGLFNGYGWHQNSSEWICYSSHEEVRQQVIAWLEEHIKNGDIEKALCFYNQGTNAKSCTYAVNYNTL